MIKKLHTLAEYKFDEMRGASPIPCSFVNGKSSIGRQITHRWKEGSSEIKILFSYLKNISISQLCKQFSRNGLNLYHFLLSEKY